MLTGPCKEQRPWNLNFTLFFWQLKQKNGIRGDFWLFQWLLFLRKRRHLCSSAVATFFLE